MKPFQDAFLQFAVERKVLRFGQFTLKSGRVSPYFFNIGEFNSGQGLAFLAKSYAAAIVDAGLEFEVLFGPAYKGIPLATATACALAQDHGLDTPWCFNRKEPKAHGEGGRFVGAELRDRVLVVDDVISSGLAIREAVAMVAGQGARPVGAVVAIDRQERGGGEVSAVQEAERDHGLRVVSIIALQDIVDFLGDRQDPAWQAQLPRIREYQDRYGL